MSDTHAGLLAQATPAEAPAGIASAADPLAALRDIELPPEPGWWPPAPGWWLLAALAVAAALLGFRRWQRWYARRRPWRAARAVIDAIEVRAIGGEDASLLAGELSDVLRRYALVRWPRTHIARLADQQWRDFLDETGAPVLGGKAGELLTRSRYRRPRAGGQAERDALTAALEASREWVDLHRPGSATTSPDAESVTPRGISVQA